MNKGYKVYQPKDDRSIQINLNFFSGPRTEADPGVGNCIWIKHIDGGRQWIWYLQ